jgi:anti-sigma regulatory factor (Ser/Thr protein kinase)
MVDQETSPGSSPLSLVIPGKPEYVVLCRLVAGALGARDSLDEETIADLKVMVTEACNCMLAREGGGGPAEREPVAEAPRPIRMDFDSRSDAFVVCVFHPQHRDLIAWLESCPPMSEAGLGLTIMRALADEMIERDAGTEGTALCLTKRLPS